MPGLSTLPHQSVADLFTQLTTSGILTGAALPAQGDGFLHVHSGSAGVVTAAANGSEVVVEMAGDGGMSMLTPDANRGRLKWGTPGAGATAAELFYQYGAGGVVDVLTMRTAKANGLINLRTGTANSIAVFEAGGRTRLGETGPIADARLHVRDADSGAPAGPAEVALVVEATPSASIQIQQADTGTGGLRWGAPGAADAASVTYQYGTGGAVNRMDLGTHLAGGTVAVLTGASDRRVVFGAGGASMFGVGPGTAAEGFVHVFKSELPGGAASAGSALVVESNGSTRLGILGQNDGDNGIDIGGPVSPGFLSLVGTYDIGAARLQVASSGGRIDFRIGNPTFALRVEDNADGAVGPSILVAPLTTFPSIASSTGGARLFTAPNGDLMCKGGGVGTVTKLANG